MVLIFSTTTELIRIPSDSVVFISADGNYSSIFTADGAEYVITMQLGQVERKISETVKTNGTLFIRIGKSLIVNRQYITYIYPSRQKLTLSDCLTFRREVSASREALKALKEYIEKEETA